MTVKPKPLPNIVNKNKSKAKVIPLGEDYARRHSVFTSNERSIYNTKSERSALKSNYGGESTTKSRNSSKRNDPSSKQPKTITVNN